jgi:hypothetical protein
MGRRPTRPITEIDLTLEEQEHVRNALQFLRLKLGGWRALMKLLKFEETTLIKSGNGSRTVTASMAFRIARLVGVSVDDLVHGKFPEEGTCPRRGHENKTAEEKPPLCLNGKPRDYRVFYCPCCLRTAVFEAPQGSPIGYTPGRCGLCTCTWFYIAKLAPNGMASMTTGPIGGPKQRKRA